MSEFQTRVPTCTLARRHGIRARRLQDNPEIAEDALWILNGFYPTGLSHASYAGHAAKLPEIAEQFAQPVLAESVADLYFLKR
jgi:hypothetical protein